MTEISLYKATGMSSMFTASHAQFISTEVLRQAQYQEKMSMAICGFSEQTKVVSSNRAVDLYALESNHTGGDTRRVLHGLHSSKETAMSSVVIAARVHALVMFTFVKFPRDATFGS